MSVPGASRGGKVKRAMGVQHSLEWAFRIESSQPELPAPRDMSGEGFGFGLEYVLLQRLALGCRVDGGQLKTAGYTHEDAEVTAATVAGLPDGFGGKRMEIRVAKLSESAFAFLESSVDEFKAHPKCSGIHFAMAVEPRLKAHMMREHWTRRCSAPRRTS